MKTKVNTLLDVTRKQVLVSEKIRKLIEYLEEINRKLNHNTDLNTIFEQIKAAEQKAEVPIVASEGNTEQPSIKINVKNDVYFIVAHTFQKKLACDLQKISKKPVFCLGIQNLEKGTNFERG